MRIILTGGGTAGHVNPAIAIAEEIRQRGKGCAILFIGRENGKENRLIENAGFKIKTINIKGLNRRSLTKNISIITQAIKAKKEAEKIIKEFNPDVILGTGGYVCWPVIKAGQHLGISTMIHESNVVPGLTTKLLANKCSRVLLNYEQTKSAIKTHGEKIVVGNPLRINFSNIDREKERKALGLEKEDFFILSFGGSIGAEKINECIFQFMEKYSSKEQGIMHIHGAGERYFEKIKDTPFAIGKNRCLILPYINDMPKLMSCADLVISRCGAITLSEIATVGVASILIPSPNVSANHQYKNGKILSDAGAATLIEEKNLNESILIDTVKSLKNNKTRRKNQAKNIKRFSNSNAAKTVVDQLYLPNNSKN